MPIEVAIIVTDSPPLITLAVAQCLCYLLYPDLPVIIPNAAIEAGWQVESNPGKHDLRPSSGSLGTVNKPGVLI